jgi:hypothetical protein
MAPKGMREKRENDNCEDFFTNNYVVGFIGKKI